MKSSHLITYLDHSTLAGAFALLENPKKNFNAFTLLDLMTCTEAFTLYDYVYTFWNGTGLIESKAISVNSELGMQMTDIEMKTVKSLNIALSNEFKEYWRSYEYFDCKSLEEKFSSILNELRERMPGHIYRPDRTYGVNEFDSLGGTLHYIFHSAFLGVGYSPTSIKSPFVSLLKREINKKIFDALDSCMAIVGDTHRKKVESLKTRFYGFNMSMVVPPIFRLVLQECSGPNYFLPALYRFRNSRIARKYRKWILKLQKRIGTGDQRELEKAVSEFNHLTKKCSGENVRGCQQFLEFIPSGIVDFKNALAETILKKSTRAIDIILHPHALLLRKLMNSLQSLEGDFELIESKFGISISDETIKDFIELSVFESKLSNLEM